MKKKLLMMLALVLVLPISIGLVGCGEKVKEGLAQKYDFDGTYKFRSIMIRDYDPTRSSDAVQFQSFDFDVDANGVYTMKADVVATRLPTAWNLMGSTGSRLDAFGTDINNLKERIENDFTIGNSPTSFRWKFKDGYAYNSVQFDTAEQWQLWRYEFTTYSTEDALDGFIFDRFSNLARFAFYTETKLLASYGLELHSYLTIMEKV